jgi:uncharacterized protein YjeT (DUF2065 family)
MKWFLYAISLYFIAVGSCIILYTSETRNVMEKILKTVDRRIVSIIPFIAGIAFLFAACASRNPWVIRFIGFMGIFKGIFIFFNPKNIHEDLMDWLLNSLSARTHKLWGIFALILGTAILSWII